MTKRSIEYENRMRDSGLKRHTVFIPNNPEAVDSIKRSAKRLRKKYNVTLPND